MRGGPDQQIYQAAWNDGNYELCTALRREHRDRAFGKAYIAENPEKAANAGTINDPRLQNEIRELIPGPRAKQVM
jgi:hypothetical protein